MIDARFEEGIRLFNEREFFDAHEIWEEAWQEYRGDDRTFLQALIQIAAGFYHAQCGNPKGARSQVSKGLAKLAPYAPRHQTIDSGTLLRSVEEWLMTYETNSPAVIASGVFPRIVRRHTTITSS